VTIVGRCDGGKRRITVCSGSAISWYPYTIDQA
jgi:hypothetical protein